MQWGERGALPAEREDAGRPATGKTRVVLGRRAALVFENPDCTAQERGELKPTGAGPTPDCVASSTGRLRFNRPHPSPQQRVHQFLIKGRRTAPPRSPKYEENFEGLLLYSHDFIKKIKATYAKHFHQRNTLKNIFFLQLLIRALIAQTGVPYVFLDRRY